MWGTINYKPLIRRVTQVVCERLLRCLIKWCTDEQSKFKLDLKKEEKEWSRPGTLTSYINGEIATLHTSAAQAVANLLCQKFEDKMHLNPKGGISGSSIIQHLDGDIKHYNPDVSLTHLDLVQVRV